MRYAVTSTLVQTTTHQLSTNHQTQQDVASTCCYQGFSGSWQFFLEGCWASRSGLKHSLIPTVCLNHTVILKYLINTELYINISKYIDELLMAKSFNKYSKIHLFQHSFPVIPFLNGKRWLKKVLWEWVFELSLGSYEVVLD